MIFTLFKEGPFVRWYGHNQRLAFCQQPIKEIFGRTDFHLEISETPIDGIQCLLDKGGDPDDSNGYRLIIKGLTYYPLEVNFWLLDQLPSTFWIKAHDIQNQPLP